MGQYLIDNNVISNYFSECFTDNGMAFVAEVIDQIPNIPVITEIEARSWINPDVHKEQIITEFIKDARVFGLNPAIVNKCVEIRRNKKIKLPDAIISATAVINDLILLTSDSDFNNIQGLRVLNPFNL